MVERERSRPTRNPPTGRSGKLMFHGAGWVYRFLEAFHGPPGRLPDLDDYDQLRALGDHWVTPDPEAEE